MFDNLRGVSILEVGAMTPGKYCGVLMVDWGARSMRIERTGGDGGISNEDLQLNRGKQSKVLNLRDPSDRGTLLDLAIVQVVGIITGTFSSIFLATPLLVLLKEHDPDTKRQTAKVLARREKVGATA